jgi:hypothetical protein
MADCGSVRDNGLKYIPYTDGYPNVDFAAKKEKRGFYHPMTARLLCPRHLQEQFERNPEHFCHDVHYDNIFISHDDFPSFLYPEGGYNPEAIDENLLRGPFLLSVCLCYENDNLLTMATVLSTHIHWTTHSPEEKPGKIAWQEKQSRSLQHNQSHPRKYRLCGSIGELSFTYTYNASLIVNTH